MDELREGDIDAIRRRARLDGRPIKSTLIRDGKNQYFYRKNKDGSSRIDAVEEDRSKPIDKRAKKGMVKTDLGDRLDHMLRKRMKE